MAHRSDQLEQRLGELIALPSVSSVNPELDMSNAAVVEYLSLWFTQAGFAVEHQLVDAARGKWNLIATLGEGSDGFVLSGHTDTVPYDAERWASDPFTLSERDGRLYGLGAADMKSFFPIILAALEGLDASTFKSPLVVLATCDEESSMAGARALLKAGRHLGRYGLIGEPTGLVPVNMHKGVMMVRIEVLGRSGHSSDPALGNSALEGMYRVIGGLLAWREAQASCHRDAAFKVAEPTLNLGCIRGGDNPNRICASCELLIDLRVLPGMVVEDMLDGVRRVAEEAVGEGGLEVTVQTLMPSVPPMHTAAESRIVRVAERLTGCPPATIAFATEGPFLTELGIETLVLGPGDIACAHQPDEFISIDRMVKMVSILRRFIEHFCCHARLS